MTRRTSRTAACTLLAALVALVALSVLAGGASAAEPVRVQTVLREDLETGRVSFEEYLLQNFRLAFAPDRVDPAYRIDGALLDPCFTPWMAEFEKRRAELSDAAIAEIEELRAPPRGLARSIYISPSGTFELTYDIAGTHAVPTTDIDPANGIPDYVERCAEFFDESWNIEITTLGFTAPRLPDDDTYDCFFQALSPGLNGYTATTGMGRTQITIDNNFLGLGHVPSPDPDGAQLGRAKAVIAHEFKHASQYTQSSWSEGYWNELDANWVMDVVFDASDIYHAWLSYGTSQLRSPRTRLHNDSGDEGNYEDLIWETYLGERFGLQFVVDFGARRAGYMGESVTRSYREVLEAYGASWDVAYPEYMEWCWFTGGRAAPGFGFEEAAAMSQMVLYQSTISAFPFTTSGSVDELAAHHRQFSVGTSTGYARIVFDGDDAHEQWTVTVIAERPDGSFDLTHPTLDAANDFDVTVATSFESLAYVGVIVTNSQRAQDGKSYSLQVSVVDGPVASPETAPRSGGLALAPAAPNPFRAATRLAFMAPSAASAVLDVHDVRGRRVRRLVGGRIAGGVGEILWDGADDEGRVLPAGVYWVRLSTTEGSAVRKVTKLR